ncbi:MAG: hypothetical protein ONA69_06350 [candidate division KSB1 bacterium]|nr:hypothetical protein [candidate division KSB1 bacterium]MDZ7346403.1 hypothetical protein [candidate division KSB1 bacterium]
MKGFSPDAALQSEYLLKGMSLLGYDAVNLAVKDFHLGGKYLMNMSQKYRLTFVSANIRYFPEDKSFVEPFVLKKLSAKPQKGLPPFEKLTVGIFGLCDERESLYQEQAGEPKLISRDPVQTAQKVVAEMAKADLIILLYNGRYVVLQELLSKVPNIDIVIVGGEYYKVEPSNNRIPIIVTTPSLGKYFGELRITLNDRKKIVNYTTFRYPLDESIADDPKLSRLVDEFLQAQAKISAE